jgi:hypothetical protein
MVVGGIGGVLGVGRRGVMRALEMTIRRLGGGSAARAAGAAQRLQRTAVRRRSTGLWERARWGWRRRRDEIVGGGCGLSRVVVRGSRDVGGVQAFLRARAIR